MPKKNRIDDLRDHLFEVLESLKDPDEPMDLERAKTVAHIAQVIVDSARVEVKFLQVTGAMKSTGFLPDGDEAEPRPPALHAAVGGRR